MNTVATGAGGPVRLEPRWVERVWGRTALEPWKEGVSQAALGEAWLTDVSCRLDPAADGASTLGELIARDPAAALGHAAGAPPVLVKLLFTSAPLSVQVHPTDAAARNGDLGPFGKNEAWFILQADADAAVWLGFEGRQQPETVRRAAEGGGIMDLLHREPVRAGDTVPVPAGTVHAIGPGIVLLEVQDPVQVTFRLFDHGRDRPLQLDDSMAVAALEPASGYAAAPPAPPVLVEAPRFVLERHALRGELALRPDGGRAHMLVALTPGVLLDGAPLRQGRAAFVPARSRPVTLGGDPDARATAEVAVVHSGPGSSPDLRHS